jgi:hypothetical protein
MDDVITDALLKKVNDMYSKPSEMYYCNSFEMASVWRATRQMTEITRIVERYKELQKKRIMTELNKTTLNKDVNEMIVEML